MNAVLPDLIAFAGAAQLTVLVASALVPIRLKWNTEFVGLSRLHRQLYWVYGGYVVLSIVSFAILSLANAPELASGSRLSRCICGYIALFWGIRLALQGVLDVKEHLTAWWLRLGYRALTVLFACFASIFAVAALLPSPS
jgi:hypothetical protein